MEPKYDVTTKFDQTQKLVKCFSDSSEKMLTLGREVLKSRKKCWQLLWTVPNQLEIFQLFRTFWWAVPSITQVILVLVRGFAYQIYTSPNNGNGSERKDLDSCFGITSIMEFKSTVMRKSAKEFNIPGWLFSSLIAKSKVPIRTYYLPH